MKNLTLAIQKFSALLVTACFFLSCNTNVVYSHYQHVPNKVWGKSDALIFNFTINDNTVPYRLSVQLRNSYLYPYQSIWLLVDEQQPNNTSIKDTIEYWLADKPGKLKGKGIALFQNRFLLRDNYHFPDTGAYQISIKHGLRDDRLPGIEDVGVLIEEYKGQ